MKKHSLKFTAFILIIALLVPVSAMAAEPRASAYISSYIAILTPIGNGQLRVVTDVTATKMVDMVGASQVSIYEADGTIAGVFFYTDPGYEGMMSYNTFTHDNVFIFQGTPGVTYAAIVEYHASDAYGGDECYYRTWGVTAT